MPEYLAPGVYVEEIERGPKPIEGVATSTAAFLGETERGPTKPKFITSQGEYLRHFGDVFGDDKYMPLAVKSFFDNGGRRMYVARIIGENAVVAEKAFDHFTVRAVGPGEASKRIWVKAEPGSVKVAGTPLGFRLTVAYWDRLLPANIGDSDFDPGAADTVPRPAVMEVFDDLRIEADSPSHWDKRVNNGNSSLIELAVPAATALADVADAGLLENGDDGDPPILKNFVGWDDNPEFRSGLSALELDLYRDVAVVTAPGQTLPAPGDVGDGIVDAIVTHCERNRYRFAVVDSPLDEPSLAKLDPRSAKDTKYAAYYYPWIIVSHPRTGRPVPIPPSGAICGIYALTDNTRGVWKAPANETIAGAISLKYDVNQGAQDNLNPKGVNAIRRFPGRGIRVWGARTLSSDPLWKYVNVRRLFIFLEASIYFATQWVVFEPNDPKLWARVQQTITLFLRSQWREGALFGEKEEEAFSVAVGRATMTEDDILNGRLIIEIGIAPVRPAEFVVFRVYQKTQEAKE